MKKIKITEKQAALLGLKKLNESDDSGLKSSGVAMGELVVRVVISGDAVPAMKDRILALIHRQDPESRVGYFEATGKIVGNIKEIKRKSIERDLKLLNPSINIEKKATSAPNLKEGVKNLVLITKEQYNRIFASGLINESDNVTGGLNRVDKTFKKEFAGKDIKNLKPVSEENITTDSGTNFNITKPNKSIPIPQKFGKSTMKESQNENDSHFKNEVKELIKYLYRKSEELSPYWEENGLKYDDICNSLKAKGIILSKNGKYELSKKLGNPEAAIKAVEDQISTLLPTPERVETEAYPMQDAPLTDAPIQDAPSLETEGNYPAGAEHDSNAPFNKTDQETTPKEPKAAQLEPLGFNKEIVLLKGPDNSMYVFYYHDIDKKNFMEYASIPRHYAGKDEDGKPEYEYDFDSAVIDGSVIAHFINDNLDKISKGEGLEAYEKGINLVKVDEPLKKELQSLYDKDKSIAKVLGPIEEVSSPEGAVNTLKTNVQKAMTPKPVTNEKPEAKQSRIVDKLKQLRDKEKQRRETGDVEETTGAASSGAFTPSFGGGPMGAEPIKRDMPNVSVVGETTAGSGSMGAYDANALPGIGRNGEFKGSKKTKAETTPQWAGGEFVKQPACSKMDNNKSAENGNCNQGASSLRTVKAKGSVNAPSLGENEIFETIAKKTGKTIEEVKEIIQSKKSKA